MLLPIQHENMSARRWPVVTLGLILLNISVFLGTHWVIERQKSQLLEIQAHALCLAARHPRLILFPRAQQWVTDFKERYPNEWAQLRDSETEPYDDWDARTRLINNPAALQVEMDSLGVQYSQWASSSVTAQYAFVSADPKPITYLTSTFLHGGWWHLFGNLWFLWLAGFVLEDAWGRPLYLLFYLSAGAAACQFDAWADPGSIIPSIGASGAIAALMGAFLVRSPRMRIRMAWFFDLGLFPFCRFWVQAYWILPVWALMESSYGTGPRDGIGHWAHVGGFLFGAMVALVVRCSGVEHKMSNAIEKKVAWMPAAELTQASDLMEDHKHDEAAAVLNNYLAANPGSLGAWNLLRAIHWQRSDIPAYRALTVKICGEHLKAREYDAAWQDYEEFLKLGGEKVPLVIWIDVCRIAEQRNDFERAVSEYKNLASTYSGERQSLIAQLAAAHLLLRRLGRPHDAMDLYEAASNSAVPHLDLAQEIESGIREAKTAMLRHDGLSRAASTKS